MKYFFTCEYQILDQGLDIGFKLYSPGHLIWLAVLAVFIGLFSQYYKKKNTGERCRIRKIFAVLIVFSEIYKDTILIIMGAPMMQYLPLHLCSFAIFGMVADAFWPERKTAGQMFAFLFLPGAAAALLFCNWTCYPFWNFMNIHSFVFHGWIICYSIMNYRSGDIRPFYRGLWKSVGILVLAAIPIYVFNRWTGQNYMFLNVPSEGSPLTVLWDIFGTQFGSTGYVGSMIALVILVLHVIFAIYCFLDKVLGNRRKEEIE